MYVPCRYTHTPFFLKRVRRSTYPLYLAGLRMRPHRLLYGIRRAAGRGLAGTRTILSKGAWGARTRFHVRACAPGALYTLALVVGYVPRVCGYAHSAVLRTALGGYALVAATQHLSLFSYTRVAPGTPHVAGAVWAQPSWWWPLDLLSPHTHVSQLSPEPGQPAAYARAGGSTSLFIWGGLWGSWAFVLLPSGQPKFLHGTTLAALGPAHPLLPQRREVILAGDARRHGARPTVRGTAKNANDHPNGGRTRALRLAQTPWARPAKKSRRPRQFVRLRALSKRGPRPSRATPLEPAPLLP